MIEFTLNPASTPPLWLPPYSQSRLPDRGEPIRAGGPQEMPTSAELRCGGGQWRKLPKGGDPLDPIAQNSPHTWSYVPSGTNVKVWPG